MTTATNGEVTILCLTDTVHINDLGVHLTRGHRVNVPLSKAMNSRDLSAAKLDGTVTIQTLRSAATVRAQEFVSSDTTHSQAPRYNPVSGNSGSVMEAIERLTSEVRAMRADITRLMQQPVVIPTVTPTVDYSPVLAKILGYMQALSANQAVTVVQGPGYTRTIPTASGDLEMFIPSNLTGVGDTPSLRVDSNNTDSQSVTGASEALKAARKKR